MYPGRTPIVLVAYVCTLLSSLIQQGNAGTRGLCAASDSVTFVCRELLGRPTDNSIAVNLCADKGLDVYVEYGMQSSMYSGRSALVSSQPGVPLTLSISGLTPDTRFYYRIRYRISGTTEFLALDEHTLHTARRPGSPFVFAIEADPHLDSATNSILYKRTLTNILGSNSDFLIDLGDTFMTEKLPVVNQAEMLKRYLLLRSCFDTVCHSVPLMLVQGNHDGELGWLLNGTADNLAVWATNMRKSYYPDPVPDGFYSGDTTNGRFTGLRQNYYAWEWGNALFVVLDVYWYTTTKPGSSKNNWDWTIGRAQYDWLKKTLEGSKSGFKFVFAHQVVGGNDTEGRGGIEAVPFYEMGGRNSDGTPGFAANRPGWPKPIHQLMIDNHVSAFFHGHDHVFVKQDLDGIVYHELPQPGYFNFSSPEKSYSNSDLAAKYGYTHGVVLPSSGYLRVSVTDTAATVDYIRTYLPEHENSKQHNGETAYSYTMKAFNTTTLVDTRSAVPEQFSLSQNYPNPFNPSTAISYQLSAHSFVTLKVFDVLGREVAVLVNETKSAGSYTVSFNAGALSLASGIYFYRITAGMFSETKKLVFAK
jgi:hypothetical protein